MTLSRIRHKPDFGRLRLAMSGPGADPRPWVLYARIDDDPDAIRWDAGTGWIADVTITSGTLAGEGPIPCRVLSSFGADDVGRFEPVSRNAEVVLIFPEGDANGMPLIVGYAFNPEDQPVPKTVNEHEIDESFALANHILVTTKGVVEEVNAHETKADENVSYEAGHDMRLVAAFSAFLLAQQTKLGDEDASEPFVRGNALVASTSQFLQGLTAETVAAGALAQALATAHAVSPPGPYPDPGIAAAAVAWQASLTALSAAISAYAVRLSTPGDVTSIRIRGV